MFLFPIDTVVVRVVHSHSVLRLGIWGLMPQGNCLLLNMEWLRSRMDNGRTDLLEWVWMNGLFEQEIRNGTCPSCGEPDTYPQVGWRMCVGWSSLCRTQWVENLVCQPNGFCHCLEELDLWPVTMTRKNCLKVPFPCDEPCVIHKVSCSGLIVL